MSVDYEIATAEEIMTTEVITVSPDMNILVAAELLLEKGVSNAPVVDKSDGTARLLGFVSERDLMQCYANGAYFFEPGTLVARVMRMHPVGVKPGTDVFTLAMIFMRHGYRHMPVLVEDELLGMVSRRDCLWALMRYYRSWREQDPATRKMPDLEHLFPQRHIVG